MPLLNPTSLVSTTLFWYQPFVFWYQPLFFWYQPVWRLVSTTLFLVSTTLFLVSTTLVLVSTSPAPTARTANLLSTQPFCLEKTTQQASTGFRARTTKPQPCLEVRPGCFPGFWNTARPVFKCAFFAVAGVCSKSDPGPRHGVGMGRMPLASIRVFGRASSVRARNSSNQAATTGTETAMRRLTVVAPVTIVPSFCVRTSSYSDVPRRIPFGNFTPAFPVVLDCCWPQGMPNNYRTIPFDRYPPCNPPKWQARRQPNLSVGDADRARSRIKRRAALGRPSKSKRQPNRLGKKRQPRSRCRHLEAPRS